MVMQALNGPSAPQRGGSRLPEIKNKIAIKARNQRGVPEHRRQLYLTPGYSKRIQVVKRFNIEGSQRVREVTVKIRQSLFFNHLFDTVNCIKK